MLSTFDGRVFIWYATLALEAWLVKDKCQMSDRTQPEWTLMAFPSAVQEAVRTSAKIPVETSSCFRLHSKAFLILYANYLTNRITKSFYFISTAYFSMVIDIQIFDQRRISEINLQVWMRVWCFYGRQKLWLFFSLNKFVLPCLLANYHSLLS